LVIYYIWYPKPFFGISNTIEPLKLLILVDVIIGPLLTFIVYKKNKSTLVMDLSIIALLQIGAFFYGIGNSKKRFWIPNIINYQE
jgi:hypothetical protein